MGRRVNESTLPPLPGLAPLGVVPGVDAPGLTTVADGITATEVHAAEVIARGADDVAGRVPGGGTAVDATEGCPGDGGAALVELDGVVDPFVRGAGLADADRALDEGAHGLAALHHVFGDADVEQPEDLAVVSGADGSLQLAAEEVLLELAEILGDHGDHVLAAAGEGAVDGLEEGQRRGLQRGDVDVGRDARGQATGTTGSATEDAHEHGRVGHSCRLRLTPADHLLVVGLEGGEHGAHVHLEELPILGGNVAFGAHGLEGHGGLLIAPQEPLLQPLVHGRVAFAAGAVEAGIDEVHGPGRGVFETEAGHEVGIEGDGDVSGLAAQSDGVREGSEEVVAEPEVVVARGGRGRRGLAGRGGAGHDAVGGVGHAGAEETVAEVGDAVAHLGGLLLVDVLDAEPGQHGLHDVELEPAEGLEVGLAVVRLVPLVVEEVTRTSLAEALHLEGNEPGNEVLSHGLGHDVLHDASACALHSDDCRYVGLRQDVHKCTG